MLKKRTGPFERLDDNQYSQGGSEHIEVKYSKLINELHSISTSENEYLMDPKAYPGAAINLKVI